MSVARLDAKSAFPTDVAKLGFRRGASAGFRSIETIVPDQRGVAADAPAVDSAPKSRAADRTEHDDGVVENRDIATQKGGATGSNAAVPFGGAGYGATGANNKAVPNGAADSVCRDVGGSLGNRSVGGPATGPHVDIAAGAATLNSGSAGSCAAGRITGNDGGFVLENYDTNVPSCGLVGSNSAVPFGGANDEITVTANAAVPSKTTESRDTSVPHPASMQVTSNLLTNAVGASDSPELKPGQSETSGGMPVGQTHADSAQPGGTSWSIRGEEPERISGREGAPSLANFTASKEPNRDRFCADNATQSGTVSELSTGDNAGDAGSKLGAGGCLNGNHSGATCVPNRDASAPSAFRCPCPKWGTASGTYPNDSGTPPALGVPENPAGVGSSQPGPARPSHDGRTNGGIAFPPYPAGAVPPPPGTSSGSKPRSKKRGVNRASSWPAKRPRSSRVASKRSVLREGEATAVYPVRVPASLASKFRRASKGGFNVGAWARRALADAWETKVTSTASLPALAARSVEEIQFSLLFVLAVLEKGEASRDVAIEEEVISTMHRVLKVLNDLGRQS